MKILLTGFERFGGWGQNPSQLLVEELTRRKTGYKAFQLVTEILPVEYSLAERRIGELFRTTDPDILLMTGASGAIDHPVLERFAINMDDEISPDNAGSVRKGAEIRKDGPAAYMTSLPLAEILHHFDRSNFRLGISNHAGTYVCNHIFYSALHSIGLSGRRVLCGFMHVPFSLLNHDKSGGTGFIRIIALTEQMLLMLASAVSSN